MDPGLVLGEAVARFLGLVGQRRPCLLVLEDLQWADADSWAVLAHVAVAAVTLPVLVVATVREDGPLSVPAAGLARLPGVTTVLLDRLSHAEVRRLAAALGATDSATLDVLDAQADGLPFLVEELVEQRQSGSAGAADVPPTLAISLHVYGADLAKFGGSSIRRTYPATLVRSRGPEVLH